MQLGISIQKKNTTVLKMYDTGMNSNDTNGCLIIYELECITVGESVTDRRRFVHLERIALYDTLENAEKAMQAYILDRKKSWGDKIYHHTCLSYQIAERTVHHSPNIEIELTTKWRGYTSDGELSKEWISNR